MKRLEENNLDKDIIIRCQNGDQKAFAEVISKFKLSLFTYLQRLSGDYNEAEDLFQDTLIRVWSYLPRYKHQNKFASWLFSIAHNVTIDSERKKKVRELVYYTDELPEHITTENPDSLLIANEVEREVENVLKSLPKKQRQVFLLRQHSGMSFKEIAEVMQQPLNSVLSHMHYAASKLKKVLKEKNVF